LAQDNDISVLHIVNASGQYGPQPLGAVSSYERLIALLRKSGSDAAIGSLGKV
jgi:hypothetical protein